MKFLAALICLISVHLHASTLGPNDIYISGTVEKIEPLCPPGDNNCFVDGSRITIKFMLPTPCYTISQFDYKVFNNNTSVEVTAVQSDLTSPQMNCIQMVHEVTKVLELVDVYRPFSLYFTSDSELSFPTKILK